MSPEVVPFARPYANNGQVDQAGQTILELLGKAAAVSEQNSRQALETAQRLADGFVLPRIRSRSSNRARGQPTESRAGGRVAASRSTAKSKNAL